MSFQSYIDVRSEKLSATAKEKERWRELMQNLNRAQRQMSDPDKIVTEYFGVDVTGSRSVPSNQNLSDCLFRKSLKAFRALYAHNHSTKQGADSCDLLISMVGFSLEPVMHTVLTLRPKHVVFVFSKDSARFRPRVKTLDYLKTLINCHGEDYNPKIEQITLESTNTALVFSSVHNTIAQASESGSVAIDVTGGKKSMDVSAFLAASLFERVAIYYVDYEEYDSATGYPVWGSEFLNELNNPYKQFNVREEHLIKKHWNRGDFTAASHLAEMMTEMLNPEMAKRYSLAEKRDLLVEIGKTAACYEAWSRFDYKEASKNKFKCFEVYHGQILDELEKCPEVFKKDKICKEEYAPLALKLAVDRYMRGKDGVQHSEWNAAALFFTQAVEALLKFTYSSKRNKELKWEKTEMMLNNLFNGHQQKKHYSVFKGESLRKRIAEDVLDKRNILSHYTCFNQSRISSTEEKEIEDIMRSMEVTTHEFLEHFAEIYGFEEKTINNLCDYLTFLQLGNDLQLKRK